METFITILIILVTMIICYYINRYVFRENENKPWEWEDVKMNCLISIIIPISIIFWIMYIIYKLPSLPEEPPKWL